jgi:hypothetical protein
MSLYKFHQTHIIRKCNDCEHYIGHEFEKLMCSNHKHDLSDTLHLCIKISACEECGRSEKKHYCPQYCHDIVKYDDYELRKLTQEKEMIKIYNERNTMTREKRYPGLKLFYSRCDSGFTDYFGLPPYHHANDWFDD